MRILLILIVIGIVVGLGVLLLPGLVFPGIFDTKYTREELTATFTNHEAAFEDAVTFFNAHLDKNLNYTVQFGISRGKRVSLDLMPLVIDPANKSLGGDDLSMDSPVLDSALRVLGWTAETARNLKAKVLLTHCDYIRKRDSGSVELWPYQSGWGSFTYLVFDQPVTDSVIQTMGRTISGSPFGKRVQLCYSSAL